ncbi:MAG: hypothetical protein WAK93_06355 [Solirubrobacteraceae bacterium]
MAGDSGLITDRVSAQISLRPIGSPLTVGMSGLTVASLVQSGVDLKWIPESQTAQAGLILVSVPFVLQLLSCVFSYLARDGASGAAIGVLATSWLAIGLIHVVSAPGATSSALGLLLLTSGLILLLSAAALRSEKPLVALVFGLAALRFATGALYELSATSLWAKVAGIIGLVLFVAAAYCVLAFELEGQAHRPVLPTFRRGRAADAVSAGVPRQLEGVANEPGVRQTT